MKKIFTLLMALPLAASVWGAETPPCKLTFLNQPEFDKWLPVDANQDGGNNQFKFNSSEQAAYYTQSYKYNACLLYTSDAADDLTREDNGGRRIIKKK